MRSMCFISDIVVALSHYLKTKVSVHERLAQDALLKARRCSSVRSLYRHRFRGRRFGVYSPAVTVRLRNDGLF